MADKDKAVKQKQVQNVMGLLSHQFMQDHHAKTAEEHKNKGLQREIEKAFERQKLEKQISDFVTNLEKHDYMEIDPELKKLLVKEDKKGPAWLNQLTKIKESKAETETSHVGDDKKSKGSARSKSSNDSLNNREKEDMEVASKPSLNIKNLNSSDGGGVVFNKSPRNNNLAHRETSVHSTGSGGRLGAKKSGRLNQSVMIDKNSSLLNKSYNLNIHENKMNLSFASHSNSQRSDRSFLQSELKSVITKNFGNKELLKQLVSVTKEFKKTQKKAIEEKQETKKPEQAGITRSSAPLPSTTGGASPLMPKLHGLSGHFHVLHQMNNPHPEHKELAKAAEEIDYQAQYVSVMQILMKTLNDIIEATPDDNIFQGDDQSMNYQSCLNESIYQSQNSDENGSLKKSALLILEEENKDLKQKLLLSSTAINQMKNKLDLILKKNQDLTQIQLEKQTKDADALLEQMKEHKNKEKKNFWTLALQLKLKKLTAEKMKKLDQNKKIFEKQMLDATDDHSDNVEMLSSQINKLSEESKKEQQSMLIKVKDLHQKHTSTKAQNWWTQAMQLHLKKLVIQKMKDNYETQIKEVHVKHDSVLKSLNDSRSLVHNLQTKHDNTLKELDKHRQKIEELTNNQQQLIKDSGVTAKQHFLLMAIKLKIQKMSVDKIKHEKQALKTNLEQVHSEKENEKKLLVQTKEGYENQIQEQLKESASLQQKIETDQKEKELIKSTHIKDLTSTQKQHFLLSAFQIKLRKIIKEKHDQSVADLQQERKKAVDDLQSEVKKLEIKENKVKTLFMQAEGAKVKADKKVLVSLEENKKQIDDLKNKHEQSQKQVEVLKTKHGQLTKKNYWINALQLKIKKIKIEKIKAEHLNTIMDKDEIQKQALLDKDAEHQELLMQKEFQAQVEKEKFEMEKSHYQLSSKENELKHLKISKQASQLSIASKQNFWIAALQLKLSKMKQERTHQEHLNSIQDKDEKHKQELLDKEAQHNEELNQKEFLARVEKEKVEKEKSYHELSSKEQEDKHAESEKKLDQIQKQNYWITALQQKLKKMSQQKLEEIHKKQLNDKDTEMQDKQSENEAKIQEKEFAQEVEMQKIENEKSLHESTSKELHEKHQQSQKEFQDFKHQQNQKAKQNFWMNALQLKLSKMKNEKLEAYQKEQQIQKQKEEQIKYAVEQGYHEFEKLRKTHESTAKQNYFMTALQLKLRKMKMEKMAILHAKDLKDKEFINQSQILNLMNNQKTKEDEYMDELIAAEQHKAELLEENKAQFEQMKAIKKQNYWATALQMKCKKLVLEKMKAHEDELQNSLLMEQASKNDLQDQLQTYINDDQQMILEKINQHKIQTEDLKQKLNDAQGEKETLRKQNYFTIALQMHLKKMVTTKLEMEKQKLIKNHEFQKEEFGRLQREKDVAHDQQLREQESESSTKLAGIRNSKLNAELKMKEAEIENEQKVVDLKQKLLKIKKHSSLELLKQNTDMKKQHSVFQKQNMLMQAIQIKVKKMAKMRLEKEKEDVTKQLEEEKNHQNKIKNQNNIERKKMELDVQEMKNQHDNILQELNQNHSLVQKQNMWILAIQTKLRKMVLEKYEKEKHDLRMKMREKDQQHQLKDVDHQLEINEQYEGIIKIQEDHKNTLKSLEEQQKIKMKKTISEKQAIKFKMTQINLMQYEKYTGQVLLFQNLSTDLQGKLKSEQIQSATIKKQNWFTTCIQHKLKKMVSKKLADTKRELKKEFLNKLSMEKQLTKEQKNSFLMLAIQTKVKKLTQERMQKVKKDHEDMLYQVQMEKLCETKRSDLEKDALQQKIRDHQTLAMQQMNSLKEQYQNGQQELLKQVTNAEKAQIKKELSDKNHSMLKKQNFWVTALQMKCKTLISNKIKQNEAQISQLKSQIEQHHQENLEKQAKIQELNKIEQNIKLKQNENEENIDKQLELLKNELVDEKKKVKLEQNKALEYNMQIKNDLTKHKQEIDKLTTQKRNLKLQVDQSAQIQEHYNICEEQMQLQLQVLEKQRKDAVANLDSFMKIQKYDKEIQTEWDEIFYNPVSPQFGSEKGFGTSFRHNIFSIGRDHDEQFKQIHDDSLQDAVAAFNLSTTQNSQKAILPFIDTINLREHLAQINDDKEKEERDKLIDQIRQEVSQRTPINSSHRSSINATVKTKNFMGEGSSIKNTNRQNRLSEVQLMSKNYNDMISPKRSLRKTVSGISASQKMLNSPDMQKIVSPGQKGAKSPVKKSQKVNPYDGGITNYWIKAKAENDKKYQEYMEQQQKLLQSDYEKLSHAFNMSSRPSTPKSMSVHSMFSSSKRSRSKLCVSKSTQHINQMNQKETMQNLSKMMAEINSPSPNIKKEQDRELDIIDEKNRKYLNMPLQIQSKVQTPVDRKQKSCKSVGGTGIKLRVSQTFKKVNAFSRKSSLSPQKIPDERSRSRSQGEQNSMTDTIGGHYDNSIIVDKMVERSRSRSNTGKYQNNNKSLNKTFGSGYLSVASSFNSAAQFSNISSKRIQRMKNPEDVESPKKKLKKAKPATINKIVARLSVHTKASDIKVKKNLGIQQETVLSQKFASAFKKSQAGMK